MFVSKQTKKANVCVFLFVLIQFPIFSQTQDNQIFSINPSNDINFHFTWISNPLNLENIEVPTLVAIAHPLVFGLKNLNSGSMGFALKLERLFAVSLATKCIASPIFSEGKIELSVCKRIFNWFLFATTLSENWLRVEDFGTRFLFRPSFYLQYDGFNHFKFSFNFLNLSFDNSYKDYSNLLCFGVQFQPFEKFNFGLDYNFNSKELSYTRISWTIMPFEFSSISLIFITKPLAFSAALNLFPNNDFSFLINSTYHTYLGFSNSIGIVLCF